MQRRRVSKLPEAGEAGVWVKGDELEQYQAETVRYGEHSGLLSETASWLLLVHCSYPVEAGLEGCDSDHARASKETCSWP